MHKELPFLVVVAGSRLMNRSVLVELLGEVSGWKLTVGRWESIARVLVEMDEALRDGREEGAASTAERVRLMGPKRIRTKLGDTPTVAAPPEIRERLNRLVLVLGEPDRADADSDE